MRASIKIFLLLLCAACQRPNGNTHQAVPFENIAAHSTKDKEWPASFGWGRKATAADIAEKDIDVRPDGKGLPKGRGTVKEGRAVYEKKCAACHGTANTNGTYARLFPHVIPDSSRGEKVIGNYWPYATTLYDYINRAMPFNQPGSLTPAEVYSVTAYLLHVNKLWPADAALHKDNLAGVNMPARDKFIPDDRKGGKEVK